MTGGSADNLAPFWRDQRRHPSLIGHPMVAAANWQSTFIPLGLHGDGVPVVGIGKSWSRSVEVVSWGSCLGTGSTILKTYMIFLLHKLLCARDSIDTYWKHVVWSLNAMFLGTWPSVDVDGVAYFPGTREWERMGKPLAGGFRATLWAIKGDLEWYANALHLENFGSLTPCFLCRANTTTHPWTDCRRGAAWSGTVWSNHAWNAARPGRHVLFSLPGVSI